MASIFDLFQSAPQPTPWIRPVASPRSSISLAPDFLTPDGHLVPRAIGEAALRDSRAVLIGDLLVLGAPDLTNRFNW